MARLAILVTGEPVPRAHEAGGDFARMIIAAGGRDDVDWQVVKVHEGAVPPDPRGVAGIIISGSPSSVTERADRMLATESCLRLAREMKIVGVVDQIGFVQYQGDCAIQAMAEDPWGLRREEGGMIGGVALGIGQNHHGGSRLRDRRGLCGTDIGRSRIVLRYQGVVRRQGVVPRPL